MKKNNPFYKKKWLKNIKRIHPPRDQQKVDNRLRLHRAERLYPFPKDFFNKFIQSIDDKDIRCYPYIHKLKDKISEKYNLKNSNIFLNNGSSENIRIFYDTFALKNKEVLITSPSYPMHRIYAELHNSKITYINYDNDLTIKYSNILNKINSNTCSIVLANPNSPIGDIINKENIIKIIDKASKLEIPILIDEAYIEYSDQESCTDLLSTYSNLIVSRTFSKAYGCAGLRIGYLLGSDLIMEVVNKLIPTYEVSSLSAKFALHLLNNENVINNYIALIKQEKLEISKICNKNSITCILNHINTIHFKLNNLEIVKDFLIQKNVLFRTRKLPYDNDEWLAIVLYPGFIKSDIFKKIVQNS